MHLRAGSRSPPLEWCSAMPTLYKNLIGFGANLLTIRAAYRLKQQQSAPVAQERVFRHLITTLARTAFGREHGLTPKICSRDYAHRLPPRDYDGFLPYLERMQAGESDVLWPGRCTLFAASAGTSTGRRKLLPVSEAMLGHLRQGTREALLSFTARVGHAGIFRGRHLLLSGCTRMNTLNPGADGQIYTGNLAGIAALNLPAWAERHLHEPGTAIAEMGDWTARLKRMIERVSAADITVMAGMPQWLLAMADQMLAEGNRHSTEHLDSIWPNLECLIHYGQALAPYHDELRQRVGPRVTFHEVYTATEACIAAQDAGANAGLRLLADIGVFYEFIPLDRFDPGDLVRSGTQALTVADVQTGVDYAVLLTTPAGLTRYVLGDVVRFVTTAPPRLLHVGRLPTAAGQLLGAGLLERELTEALVTLCRLNEWRLVEFHVAPVTISEAVGPPGPAHEWWIELKPGTVRTPIGPAIARDLDATLQTLSATYRTQRLGRALLAPVVRLVMPGTFRHWMQHHHSWGAPHRVDRVGTDRRIADDLAKIAPFYQA